MKQSHLNEQEISSIFSNLHLKDSREFTAVLQPFKKRYSNYGPLFDKDKQWVEVFQTALALYLQANFMEAGIYGATTADFADTFDNIIGVHKLNPAIDAGIYQYNLLRFMRLLATAFAVQVHCHRDLGRIYWNTLFNQNGKIRNAGYQFLGNMQFGLPSYTKNGTTKPVRQHWMELFFALLRTERDFEITNRKFLLRSDLTGRKWRKHSTETKDVFLKNIRRGIELIDRGFYFDEILEDFGMLEQVRDAESVQKYYNFKKEFGLV